MPGSSRSSRCRASSVTVRHPAAGRPRTAPAVRRARREVAVVAERDQRRPTVGSTAPPVRSAARSATPTAAANSGLTRRTRPADALTQDSSESARKRLHARSMASSSVRSSATASGVARLLDHHHRRAPEGRERSRRPGRAHEPPEVTGGGAGAGCGWACGWGADAGGEDCGACRRRRTSATRRRRRTSSAGAPSGVRRALQGPAGGNRRRRPSARCRRGSRARRVARVSARRGRRRPTRGRQARPIAVARRRSRRRHASRAGRPRRRAAN